MDTWDRSVWSSAIGKQTWIERLRDHNNIFMLVKQGTETIMGYLHEHTNQWAEDFHIRP